MRYGEYRGHRIRFEQTDCWEAIVYASTGHPIGTRLMATLEEGEAAILRRAAALVDARIAATQARANRLARAG